MAKKSIFDFDKWERKHVAQMGARSKAIKKLFDDLAHQASLLGIDVNLESDEEFNFKDYPALEKRIDELVKEVAKKVTKEITDAEEEAWLQANAKNDALVDAVVKGTGVPKDVVSQWKQPNLSALVAFQARKIAGMGLSRRVWALTKSAKQELELALDIGIGEGKSAAELSRDIRQYLNEPDKLFRRVRDKHGILRLSKAAQAYHPGRGVYRSSYKNALRLAQTEINMAYRSADHERWEQEPWVIGQRICLSNNHTLNGLPFHDICDDVQGVYPKDFKFVGWHPKCRCYKIPELAKREERIAYLKKMANGEDVSGYKFSGEVKEVPEGFNKWLQDNAERIQRAEGRGTLPYFLRDNGSFFTHDKEGLLKLAPHKKTPFEIATERHAMRTPEQAKAIVDKARMRQRSIASAKQYLADFEDMSGVDTSALREAYKHGRWGDVRIEALKLAQKKRSIVENGISLKNEFENILDIDIEKIKGALKSGKMSDITSQIDILNQMKERESVLVDLIPNAHLLHQSYSIAELEKAHKELSSVMNRWLAKYNYSSLNAAPLQHLKNKLDFELSSPTIAYSNKELVKKSIMDKIRVIDQKIEWENLITKASSLKTFKTKSTIFKDYLKKIENAIQNNDFKALQDSITEAEKQRIKLIDKQIKRGGDVESALNKEYKGGAIGKDITSNFDVANMKSEDPYNGTFTNNAARLQGFDAPAKLVSEEEFAILEDACGDVFYRTVNPTTFKGKRISSQEFAAQLYEADLLELNGPGGRVHGDGMYVATSAWDGKSVHSLTDIRKRGAYDSSICYGNGNHTISEMTWTRKPKIITAKELNGKWNKLSISERAKYGNNRNTYGCALGYDAMYCDRVDYMVIWNRSIIAVKKK